MGQAGPALFAVGGRIIGSYFGGPVGGMIGGIAGGLIGSFIFNRNRQPLIPDWQIASSSYGHTIPILYGQARLPGQIFWEGDVTTKSHGQFGKGIGGTQGPQTSYYRSAAAAFCFGPAQLLKIWLDGTMFYDATSPQPRELTHTGGGFPIRTYTGTEEQLPDFEIQAWVNNHVASQACPAYRGLAYLLMNRVDMAAYGMRMPSVTALWSMNASTTTTFRQLKRFSPDTSGLNVPVYKNALAADFTRGSVYSLDRSGTLRAYNIASGLETNARVQGDVIGIAAGSATMLYGFTGTYGGLYGTDWIDILTIDPGSLEIVNRMPIDMPLFGGGSQGTPMPFVAATLPDPKLPFDMVAGSFGLLGGSGFVCNPASGAFGIWHGPAATVFSSGSACFGLQDPVVGSIDVYFTQYDPFDPGSIFHIAKTTLLGSDWAQSSLLDLAGGDFTFYPGLDPAVHDIGPDRFGVSAGLNRATVVYDASDDTVIVGNIQYGAVRSFKYAFDSDTIVWTSTSGAINNAGGASNFDLGSGAASFFASSIEVIDTTSGQTSQSPVPTGSPGATDAVVTMIYDSFSQSLVYWGYDNEIYIAAVQRKASGTVLIADIIVDLCKRVGLTPDMLDVSLVTTEIEGYVVNAQKPIQACLADLCQSFQIDIVESDYKLKFVPRGTPAAAGIAQADLASPSQDDPTQFWTETRPQEQEMPLQINLRWTDPQLDYQPNTTYAKRIALPNIVTQFAKRVQTVDLPVITDALTARQIAETWLWTLWAERNTYQTTLSPKFLFLDPGDNVFVTLDNGDSYELRIDSIETGADFSIRAHLSSENVSTYALTSSTTRPADMGYVGQVVVPDAFAELLMFNVPLLRDSDDLAGAASRIYYAAGVTPGATSVARLYRSTDGSSYPLFDTMTGFPTWGYTRTVLGDTPTPFSTDHINTLTVSFTGEQPSSCTFTEMMSGANALLVGQEIIQFQNVTPNADGTCTLDTLVRARRGTEWATGSHRAGEVAVILVAGELGANRLLLSELNTPELYRLVPNGRFLDQTPTTSFAYRGYDLMPYAPVRLKRAPSGSDLLLSWTRRTRVGGNLVDGTDTAPLGEVVELYEAYLLPNAAALADFDPTVPASYRRQFTALSVPHVTYTAAMMAADGFTPATDTLFMVCYQVSAAIGRGFRAYAALPAF